MSIPSSDHPLLALVDANKNTLKCALVKYIDVTVERQFGQIRNRIVHMIESGEIVLSEVNASDQQFTSDIFPSLVNTVTTKLTQIKHECHDTSSLSTIPINVHCSDAANGDDYNQSIHVGIEVNESKNAQVPIDDVKEEYDDDVDDDVDEEEGEYMSDCAGCEDCVNGICGLVGAHDDAHTGVDMQSGLGEGVIEDEQSVSLESDLMIISNVIDASNQSTNNANDLITECDQQIRNNQNAIKQNIENGQSVQPIEDNQQSIPSTSGLRSSGRKRIQRKLFGDDDQSSGKVKSDTRKSKSNSRKAVKKMKPQNVREIPQEEEVAKRQVVTLQVNCTEDGCKAFLNSVEMWKEHLSSHGQVPYKHLHDNVRHNQQGQTEYACTECNAMHKSQHTLIEHWRRYHLAGKYQCSTCAFVANFRSEVQNHQHSHLSSKFQCTHEGCNQAFPFMNHLERHQLIHSGETPYRCTWDNCEVSFNQIGTAIQHVRRKHFHLPRTIKKQKDLNIIDERDAKVYIQVSRG